MAFILQDWKLHLGTIIVALFLYLYYKIKSIYATFDQIGLRYVKPTFLLGSDPSGALGKHSIGEAFTRMYKELDGEEVGGIFLGINPIFLVRDPEYINSIFTAHYDHFPDRSFMINEKVNPLEAHIFFLKGKRWRYLRNKLSPMFSTGKLKYMYEQMDDCSNELCEYIKTSVCGKPIDLRETFARFSTDVIATTFFGLEPDSLKNPDSKFRAMGKKFFELTWRNVFLFTLRFTAPSLLVKLGLRTVDKPSADYFMSIIKDVTKFRRDTKNTRNDFIQLCLQTQDKSNVEGENTTTQQIYNGKVIQPIEFTDTLLAAQSFGFYLAGFETTSTSLHFLTYMLALHQDIQDKVRMEVRQVKSKHGGFTFDALKDLTYMDQVMAESLRLFPPVPWIMRECAKDFQFPNGVPIKKGQIIGFSMFAMHYDPKFFPNPHKFDPDRFENAPIRGTYFPFGDGPRICIGKRFAQVQMKLTIAKLLDRYILEAISNEGVEMKFASTLTLTPKNPLLININQIKQ